MQFQTGLFRRKLGQLETFPQRLTRMHKSARYETGPQILAPSSMVFGEFWDVKATQLKVAEVEKF